MLSPERDNRAVNESELRAVNESELKIAGDAAPEVFTESTSKVALYVQGSFEEGSGR
jgi:hypothetical protein